MTRAVYVSDDQLEKLRAAAKALRKHADEAAERMTRGVNRLAAKVGIAERGEVRIEALDAQADFAEVMLALVEGEQHKERP